MEGLEAARSQAGRSLVGPAIVLLGLVATGVQLGCHADHLVGSQHPLANASQRAKHTQLFAHPNALSNDQSAHADQCPETRAQNHHLHSNNNEPVSLASEMLKAFIRANDIRAYDLDLHDYRPELRLAGDPNFVDTDNLQHQRRCAKHLSHYHAALMSFNQFDPILQKLQISALRLADSYGRPQSAILEGNQFWLGHYEMCKTIQIPIERAVLDESAFDKQQDEHYGSPANDQQFVGSQYCVGVSQFPNWNPKDSRTAVKVGLCLPETCTNAMLNENRNLFNQVEQMMRLQLEQKPFDRLRLRQIYCLPHDTSPVRQLSLSARILIGVVGTFGCMCLVASVLDYVNSKAMEADGPLKPGLASERTWRTIVMESFSIQRNVEKFFHLPSPTVTTQPTTDCVTEPPFNKSLLLDSTAGMKCIGLVWIICAHSFLVTPILSSNLLHTDVLTQTYLANVLLTAHLMVDTFFTISGMLASYFMFRSGTLSNMKTKNWLVMTAHRYWRLTPIYLLCYWFTKELGYQLGHGPMWDYSTSPISPRSQCTAESWWHAILHLSDFKSPKEHCVPFAWFIANGMKFWLVTPPFLTLILKSTRRGYQAVIGVIVASSAIVTVLAFRSNVDMKSVVNFKPESGNNMLNNMDQVYTRPYSRIGTYLIGLLFGHLLYMIESHQVQVKLSKNTKTIVWTSVTIAVLVLTFTLKLASSVELDESAIPFVFSISSGLIRPIWSVCTCWLIFALGQDQLPTLAKFLSANFWRILVKLSFCAYLVQGEVIVQFYLTPTVTERYTYIDMISRPIVVTFVTCVVSFIMVLLLEYPLIGIEELLLPRHKSSTQVGQGASNNKGCNQLNNDQSRAGPATNEKLKTS